MTAAQSGQLATAVLWGWASDRFGRRPTLLLSMLGAAVCFGAFGFVQSFQVALGVNFLSGALNGVVGIGKTVMGELCDDSNASKCWAVLGTTNALVRISAPPLGGFLAEPARKYDMFKHEALWTSYPYALPCVTGDKVC